MHLTFVLCFLVGTGQAQTLSTKAVKVILAVDSKSDDVTDITLFSTLEKMDKRHLKKKYANHKFYMGLLKGTYEIEGTEVIPEEDTTIIMYTEKQFFPEAYFFSAENLSPGDSFDVGKTRAKVVSNKKGELTVKILRTVGNNN